MATGRVPQKDSEFNTYIINTDDVLQEVGPPTGATRLGLSAPEATDWHNYRTQWETTYTAYSNPATRTSTITQAKNQLKDEFTAFSRMLLKRIESSANLTLDDRAIFNLPIADTTPTARGPILEIPSGNFVGLGGGKLEVRAKRTTDAARVSMHPLADVVEIKYTIENDPASPPMPIPPGSDNNPDLFPHSQVSTKAQFVLTFSNVYLGKRIVAAMRWINLTDPANNSGWSDLFSTVIA